MMFTAVVLTLLFTGTFAGTMTYYNPTDPGEFRSAAMMSSQTPKLKQGLTM
jgi:hypothetical protein